MAVVEDDFREALKLIEPSSLREVMAEIPDIHWDDIGGMEDVKRERDDDITRWAEIIRNDEGRVAYIFANNHYEGFSPTHLLRTSGPLTEIKFALLSLATALASSVFPTPGGP